MISFLDDPTSPLVNTKGDCTAVASTERLPCRVDDVATGENPVCPCSADRYDHAVIMAKERVGTVTALNADVVGYSRLLADDFDATSEAMTHARTVVEKETTAHHGTLVNFVGDNFMAVFENVRDGTDAAITIATALEHANDGKPDSEVLRFRMGMDLGSVSVSDGHYEGDALNIAARIQALASAGGLSVSGAVYRALDEPALRFRPTGTQRLKNIPESVEIYELSDLPSDGHGMTTRSSLRLEEPMVTVIPTHMEEVDGELASAAAIIRGELLHRLAEIPGLRVIEATDKEHGVSTDGISRYMLETGVHQVGDNVRAYAIVIDISTMNVVKGHKESAKISELFDLSDRLADAVANTISVDLVVGAPAGLYADLGDPISINKVNLGWYHLRSDTREGWERARTLFGEVAASHPDLPYGHVLSGFTNWVGVAYGWVPDPDATLALALEQAKIGTDMGDPTGLAAAVDAAVLMAMGRVNEAIAELDGLEKTRPTCDVTFALEGSVRRYLGQWEEAVDLLDVAMRLTAVNKPWYPTVKACSLFIGNRLDQAASVAEGVLEYQPTNLEALMVLAAVQVELGQDRRAHATAQRIRAAFPTLDAAEWIDRSPYQDPAIAHRWKSDLKKLDLIAE